MQLIKAPSVYLSLLGNRQVGDPVVCCVSPFPRHYHLWEQPLVSHLPDSLVVYCDPSGKDLVVSHNQCSRVNIIVWVLHKELTMLEVRAKLADVGLESFVRGNVLWEGDHNY